MVGLWTVTVRTRVSHHEYPSAVAPGSKGTPGTDLTRAASGEQRACWQKKQIITS
jgi:hypothetical protein